MLLRFLYVILWFLEDIAAEAEIKLIVTIETL